MVFMVYFAINIVSCMCDYCHVNIGVRNFEELRIFYLPNNNRRSEIEVRGNSAFGQGL
jgi:hypothetical protein